jgi:Sec-independent protein translocase protein TatA
MRSGIGLSEALLILALVVIFVDSKKIPGLIRKTVKFVGQIRAAVKKLLDDIGA